MGWASGTELFDEIMDIVLPMIDPRNKENLFRELLNTFTHRDWDCINESKYWTAYPEFRAIYREMFPND